MPEPLFDTHAHYNSPRFDRDRHTALAALPQRGVGLVLNVGYDMPTSRLAVEIAERWPHAYAAVGIHPHDAETLTPEAVAELRALAAHPKVVAIGEIGLDFYRNLSPRDAQNTAFRQQMALARELGLPAIVHDRDAHRECLDVVREFPGQPAVFHCYAGSAEMAKTLVSLGHSISFTANITYPKAGEARDAALAAGLDSIMIETDCPYLAPQSHRGQRNESTLVYTVAEQLADWFGVTAERVAEITARNGKRFFGVSP